MIQKEKSRFGRDGSEKGKMMFTAIRSSYLYLESLKIATLDYKEWGLCVVRSDKNRLGGNVVMKDVDLPV